MAKLTEEHLKYLKNEEFYEKYKNLLLSRFIPLNNQMEADDLKIEELFAAEHADTLDDNIEVLGIIIEQIRFIYDLRDSLNKTTDEQLKKEIKRHIAVGEKITQDFIIEIANIFNREAAKKYYISLGYRKIDNNVMFDGKYPIEKAKNIEKKMEELLDNYYGPWSKLDVFEREARFNIEFLRIHPFEDGNGRTSRVLLNFNLLLQGHAPVLLPSTIKKEYFDARNREDVQSIKELFERESEKELNLISNKIVKFINRYNFENERGYTL